MRHENLMLTPDRGIRLRSYMFDLPYLCPYFGHYHIISVSLFFAVSCPHQKGVAPLAR